MNEIIKHIDESIRTKEELKKQSSLIQKAANLVIQSLQKGGKVILFGNGGSAADAQHIAAEFVGKFILERKGLPAISLTTNTSILTAIGNDMGFETVFSRQIDALAEKNDIIIAISTSGNSNNVVHAVKFANKNKLTTIGLTGKTGGRLSSLVNLAIKVPSNNTQHIQESHILIGHIIVSLVETRLKIT